MCNTAKSRQFVVNFHINEICNFNCRYCYADWGLKANRFDVFRQKSLRERVISELWSLVDPSTRDSWFVPSLSWERSRLNIAGGEPLLYKAEVLAGIEYARALGFDVSIITNGSRLTAELAKELAPGLDWLGISIDSLVPTTNAQIGRFDQQNRQLSLERITEAIDAARSRNPDIRIKVNTVVNSHNAHEDLSEFIDATKPEKWKVFRTLPATTDALSITEDDFAGFVQRHAKFYQTMRAENNDTMLASYLMVDPLGRFFDNRDCLRSQSYQYSDPIHEVGARKAFSQITFDAKAFNARYSAEQLIEEVVK